MLVQYILECLWLAKSSIRRYTKLLFFFNRWEKPIFSIVVKKLVFRLLRKTNHFSIEQLGSSSQLMLNKWKNVIYREKLLKTFNCNVFVCFN